MSVRLRTPRLAILTIAGAGALSVAALSAPAPAHAQGDRVIGPIASVSGDTFQVTRPTGAATVGVTDSTMVTEAIPAQLSEVTVGSCIKAGTDEEGAPAGNAITAKWVSISTAVDGKCPQRPGSAPATPAQHQRIRGIVDSAAGNTVTVTRADGGGTAIVTVTDATRYHKRVPADRHAIAAGKCAVARGTEDGGGVLQATKVTVWAPTGSGCPQPGD